MRQTVEFFPLRISLTVTVLLGMPAYYSFIDRLTGMGYLAISSKWQAGTLILSIFGGLVCLLAVSSWLRPFGSRYLSFLEWVQGYMKRAGHWNLPFFGLMLLSLAALIVGPWGIYLEDGTIQVLLLWLGALAGASFLRAALPERSWLFWWLLAWVGSAVILQAGSFLSDVTPYPFVLNFSEGSQLFEASRLAAQKIYGTSLPLPLYNPARMVLKVILFWLPGVMPIWGHRLWEALLWIILPLLTSLALAHRLKIEKTPEKLLLVFGAALFLYQGPVFYELFPIVLAVLLGFDAKHFWKTVLIVILSSLWAGLTRVNWFPMPGALAVILYLLETNYSGTLRGYLWKPAAWAAVGMAAAFGAKSVYVAVSGYPSYYFTYMFGAEMLWYRLLPSSTFPLGILLSIILVSILSLFLTAWSLKFFVPCLHWVRPVGLLLTLAIFLAGGLIVSVKIGGGNNIHNLDAFLVLLVVMTSYLYIGALPPDGTALLPERNREMLNGSVFAVLLLPVIFLSPFRFTRFSDTDIAFANRVIRDVQENLPGGGTKPNVLFLHQPHLPAVQLIRNITPVDQYFDSILFDMAFTQNREYLGHFYNDLHNRRFEAIIAGLLPTNQQNPGQVFGEENNAWAKWVSKPVLCFYTQSEFWREFNLQLLVPWEDTTDCQDAYLSDW